MKEYSIYIWFAIIIVCSFIGFLIENLWIGIRFGYFDNRNMNLPFILGYGVAVLIFYAVLGIPDRVPDIKYFFCTFLMVSVGEILLGKIVERVCGIYYWDYTSLPFHFTRYTSLFTSLGFAFIITKFMRLCFPMIAVFFAAHDTVITRIGNMVGVAALVVDFFFSFYQIRKKGDFNKKWELRIREEQSRATKLS